ncbi:MAG TPA: aldose 1-epimerase [Candidatus Nitrosocosmicus sp.]|nr:aldose 1-epimerase [Candidatus Nitrosocosmicus sp.]
MNTNFTHEIIEHENLGKVIYLTYKNKENPAKTIKVGIAPDFGSNLFSFMVGEDELIYTDANALAEKHDFTGCFVLWPFPNRITDRKYTFNGKTYSLEDVEIPRGNASLVHGLVRDRKWEYEEPQLNSDSISVKTSVVMDEKSPYFADYPFPSRLSLTFTLSSKGIKTEYTVENLGDEEMPFGFALHPAFSTLITGADKTLVSIPAIQVMEADEELLPTGRILDVTGVMYKQFNLLEPVPVSALKLDHVFTGMDPDQSACVYYEGKNMKLKLNTSSEFTHFVIYTLEGDRFVCLENQTCATDAPNLATQGKENIAHLLTVMPGQAHTGFIEFEIEHV